MRRPGATGRIARTIVALALLATVVWLNTATLIDAYGSGPPYYGRTTNMDKWTNPLWSLLPLDVMVIAAVFALTYRKP